MIANHSVCSTNFHPVPQSLYTIAHVVVKMQATNSNQMF